ncbi:hypothetical protein [Occultella kanbiaonis]|nr:hypothetical protein [Occultella kanbiaonis]
MLLPAAFILLGVVAVTFLRKAPAAKDRAPAEVPAHAAADLRAR